MFTATVSDKMSEKIRIKALLTSQLQQGLSPHQLSLAFALGVTIGTMPLIWGSSLLCIFLAGAFRLNQAVVQCANYLVYPLQILLFVPYLAGGDSLFATALLPADSSALLESIRTQPGLFFRNFPQANIQALAVWLISAPLAVALSYRLAMTITGTCGNGKIGGPNRKKTKSSNTPISS